MKHFEKSMYELIERASVTLPADVKNAIRQAKKLENAGTRAALALATIEQNIEMADVNVSPLCQDTGMLTFYIHVPVGVNQLRMQEDIRRAIVRATNEGKLRPNSVDSLTGKNTGDNIGPGMPVFHFEQWERNEIEVKLILKGGGCENKNIQYSLPTELEGLGTAGRDLDGVRKCILHAVYQAQGHGCGAGFIGVGIGGDRASGYDLAKRQLFRPLDDVNPVEELRQLEQYILVHANQLGIGTMGFGGEVTLLGCKIGAMNRLPASFFVSVAYNCWAFRRQGVLIDPETGEIREWQYENASHAPLELDESAFVGDRIGSGRTVELTTPLTEEQIRELRVGDVVILNGLIYTGRDALHKYLVDHDAPVDLNGAVLYHCGPVMLRDGKGNWQVKAAGPTTSMREEPYQGDIMKKFGIRAVIGKGGMGAKTLRALREHGGVYLNAIGGAAQYYAKTVKGVKGVDFLEFGIPEAMWHLEVEGFSAIVTMDSHGNSLHADIEKSSLERLERFRERVF